MQSSRFESYYCIYMCCSLVDVHSWKYLYTISYKTISPVHWKQGMYIWSQRRRRRRNTFRWLTLSFQGIPLHNIINDKRSINNLFIFLCKKDKNKIQNIDIDTSKHKVMQRQILPTTLHVYLNINLFSFDAFLASFSLYYYFVSRSSLCVSNNINRAGY